MHYCLKMVINGQQQFHSEADGVGERTIGRTEDLSNELDVRTVWENFELEL